MSIRDTIKKSVLNSFAGADLSVQTIALCLAITAVLGLYIYLFYRIASRSALYARDFNKALALLPLITAGILLAMQSSLVISLGAVGALSIVRFRNAVKSSMDLMYLFWAVSVGIICGAQLYGIALMICLIISALILLLDLVPVRRAPLLLMVSGSLDLEQDLAPVLKSCCRRATVKSRSLTGEQTDLVIELVTRDPAALCRACAALSSVTQADLLAHDGEVRC